MTLGSCEKCLVMDDSLNVLPISSHAANITPVDANYKDHSSETEELKSLQESLQDTQPVGVLVNACKTLDQVKRNSNGIFSFYLNIFLSIFV